MTDYIAGGGVVSESIIEPINAEWQSANGVLGVRLVRGEVFRIEHPRTGHISMSSAEALELQRLLDNALRWLNRRIAIENNNPKGTTP